MKNIVLKIRHFIRPLTKKNEKHLVKNKVLYQETEYARKSGKQKQTALKIKSPIMANIVKLGSKQIRKKTTAIQRNDKWKLKKSFQVNNLAS